MQRKSTLINLRLYVIAAAVFVFNAFVLQSCGGDDPEPQPKSQIELFAGASLKVWGIEKLYVNDTIIQLTSEQLRYTKTYKRDNSYADSDGMQGTWLLDAGGATLREDISIGGQGSLTYKIESLTESSMRLRLISDAGQTLNTLYHFSAK